MIEHERIRVLQDGDDPAAVGFDDSELPILRQDDGWWLRYRDADGAEHEHLLAGAVEDQELAVHQARAWLDRTPRLAAWPHHESPGL